MMHDLGDNFFTHLHALGPMVAVDAQRGGQRQAEAVNEGGDAGGGLLLCLALLCRVVEVGEVWGCWLMVCGWDWREGKETSNHAHTSKTSYLELAVALAEARVQHLGGGAHPVLFVCV